MKQVVKSKRLVIVAMLLLAAFLTGCTLIPIEGQPWHDKYQIKLAGNGSVSQRFYSSDRNLTMIKVYMLPSLELKALRKKQKEKTVLNNPQTAVGSTLVSLAKKEVVLTLREDSGKFVAKATLPIKNITKANFYTFKFKAIKNSKQKWYRFNLSLNGQPKVPILLGVGKRQGEKYSGYLLFVNKQIYPNYILRFRPYISSSFSMVVHSIGSRFLAEKTFLAAYFSFLFVLLLFIGISWRQAQTESTNKLQDKKLTVK